MKQNIKRFLAITCLILSLFAVTITGYATTGTDNESTSSAQTSGRIIGCLLYTSNNDSVFRVVEAKLFEVVCNFTPLIINLVVV